MSNQQAGVCIFAKDIYKVADFYRVLLDLKIREKNTGVVRLEGGCLQLVVHDIPKSIAAKITIDTPPKRRSNTAMKPIFFVTSIESLRDLVARHGGELNPPSKVWEFDGHKACDGFDCEGNVFQLREAQ